MLADRVDLFSPRFTFAHRIELGRIIEKAGVADYDAYKEIYECLHERAPKITAANAVQHVAYFEEIVKGLTEWIRREALLEYKPTPEEVQAGIRDLSKKLGYTGTVNALARSFHTDPDTVLTWSYGKVYTILYADNEERKYAKKLNKIHKDKNDTKQGRYRNNRG